jgi:hypothetical protein
VTIIHVNSHTIRANKKGPIEKFAGPISVRRTRSAKAEPACYVQINDAAGKAVALVRYEPFRPLGCGAQVWIETFNPAVVLG